MRTKICGITSIKDAMIAIEAGADALGFVFYPPSPRYISIENAKNIISELPPFIEKVALFVNVTSEEVNETCQKVGATLAQLHFDVEQEYLQKLTIPYLQVIRAQCKEDITVDKYVLIDAYCEAYGGTGKRLNIEWFENIDCSKIILAGGLDSSNVASLKKYGFYGVDVSSGVELSKGIKDKTKVEHFIANAK